MSKCNGCEGCSMKCPDKSGCPMCQNKGLNVPYDTVKALSDEYLSNTMQEEQYYLCTCKSCEVGYYSQSGKIIKTDHLKTDIWFKNNRKKFMICYCRDITLEDVVFAVNKINDVVTIPKVIHFLQKDDIKCDCLHMNPLGVNCDKLFVNAIEYAKKIKNKELKN